MFRLLRSKFQSLRSVVILGILYAITQSIVVMMVKPLGIQTFLHLQVGFSRGFYLATFNLWKAQGLFPFYRLHLYPDLVHPAFYALFFASLMAYFLRSEPEAQRFEWILIFPLTAGLSDYLENAVQFFFLSGDSHITDVLVWVSSLASVVKWSFMGLSLVLILLLGIRRRMNSKKVP